jgi:threonine synthase
VSDADIKASLLMMGRKGFCIEPTSAAATAGVSKFLRRSVQEGAIVSILTGHGLKAAEKLAAL